MTKIAPQRKKIASKGPRRKTTRQPSKVKTAGRKPTARKVSLPSSKGRRVEAMGRALEAYGIMTSDVLVVLPSAPLREVAKALLSRHISVQIACRRAWPVAPR